MAEEFFVGVDVCKLWLDVAFSDQSEVVRLSNDAKGIKQLIGQVAPKHAKLVAMESTGGYENALLEALWANEIPCVRLNPRRVRRFAESLGLEAKTDVIDAKVIVMFARVIPHEPTPPRSAAMKELEELSKLRSQLVRQRTREKNQLEHYTEKFAISSIKESIAHLQKLIERIEKQIKKAIARDEKFSSQDEFQQQQPGIGAVTSAVLIARLPELGTLDRKQIASLVGLAPFNQDSGEHRGQRTIRGGRHDVRTTLYMATLSAIRSDPAISSTYQRLVSRGKPTKVAMVACMRKQLVRLNAQIRDHRAQIASAQA